MKNGISIFSLTVLCSLFLYGGEETKNKETFAVYSLSEKDSVENVPQEEDGPKKSFFGGRKPIAAIYSLIVPGSGQTILGSPYKGVSFTIVAFGTALTTLISHNNFVASNERMDALEFQYKTTTTWTGADQLYKSMIETHTKLVRYKKTRNTFALISAFVWTINIADVLFNTDDDGELLFSTVSFSNSTVLLANGIVDTQQKLNISVPLD